MLILLPPKYIVLNSTRLLNASCGTKETLLTITKNASKFFIGCKQLKLKSDASQSSTVKEKGIFPFSVKEITVFKEQNC